MAFIWLGYDSFTLQLGRRKQDNGHNRATSLDWSIFGLIISELAQLPARRAYSPEGGPGLPSKNYNDLRISFDKTN